MPIKLIIVTAFIILFSGCSVDDARDIASPSERDTSSFETGVRGTWKGTLNDKEEGNLRGKAQVELILRNDKTFEAKLFTTKESTQIEAKAEGNYYPVPPDRIAFETKESTFYPQFAPGIITTMLATPLGDSLTLKFDDSEFTLILDKKEQENKEPSQDLGGLHESCTSLSTNGRRLTFKMDQNLNFKATLTESNGEVQLSGNLCEKKDGVGDRPPTYYCGVVEASDPNFIGSSIDYEPELQYDGANQKVVSKLFKLRLRNANTLTFSCR